MKLNTIYNEDCLITMASMPDNFIDLVVTSPPYDNLRSYRGYSFGFPSIAIELFRIIRPGGIVVWITADQTIKQSETGTSFRQALYFKDIGFNFHDTMIYHKSNMAFPRYGHKKYPGAFEYMFVLVKPGGAITFNIIQDRKNIYAGSKMSGTVRKEDGTLKKSHSNGRIIKGLGCRNNVWSYTPGNMLSTKDKIAFKHPAIFPEDLVKDHILSWSNPGDIVYDPFMGSGTTAKIARHLGRWYIGSEISKEYCDIAENRLWDDRE